MPPSDREARIIERDFDIDELIDAITEFARDWSDNGIDLYPDGVEQFRAGLYPIFGIPPPPGEQP